MNIHEALQNIHSAFHEPLGEFALPQAEEILMTLLRCTRTTLYLQSKRELASDNINQINSIVKRRLDGEPLQYILGTVYFYSREFRVTPDVLIPRPDTETLVEQVLHHEKKQNCRFADIGTGSGIIACILTEERPDWHATGIDLSYKSLRIAKSNARTPIQFICCSMLDAIKQSRRFDFLVSNPPYISASETKILDPQVRLYEPYHALSDGGDGLGFYREFALHAYKWIIPDGAMYCEIGYNQADTVRSLFNSNGWRQITIFKDIGGNPRVIRAQVPEHTTNG